MKDLGDRPQEQAGHDAKSTPGDVGYVVYGAGGHARVVLDALLASQKPVVGLLDDAVAVGRTVLGFPVVGNMSWLERNKSAHVALGVGDNAQRGRIAAECERLGATLVVVVHPSAVVSRFATIGAGTVVLAAAVINAGATCGVGCIVNSAAVVEHDCTIGDFAHVSPNATLAGGAALGTGAHLGAAACVLPRIVVGAGTIIGAGAVVTREIPPRCVAAGVPARVLRLLVEE